jgi:hypothetical protein
VDDVVGAAGRQIGKQIAVVSSNMKWLFELYRQFLEQRSGGSVEIDDTAAHQAQGIWRT